MSAIYLDNNATTRVDERVADLVMSYSTQEYGNAGSRTHGWGSTAAKAVEDARSRIADVVSARSDEVFFTSGATEANNLAILGLAERGRRTGRNHLVTTAVEHKAVLEPFEHLAKSEGFELTTLPVGEQGWPSPEVLKESLRPDTLLVSTMHVNNETGVELPLSAYAEVLDEHPAWWHVDAAQGFGKASSGALREHRIDLLSVSGHKVYGPKGIGALIARRRGYDRVPLAPLMYGGGQERGLRPGTLPVALVAGFGEAARLASVEAEAREAACRQYRDAVIEGLGRLNPLLNGDPSRVLPHVLNLSIPGVDAEAAMVVTKDLIGISNGSACTSNSYEPSHVLTAMGLEPTRIAGALRISWSHDTPPVDWSAVADRLAKFSE